MMIDLHTVTTESTACDTSAALPTLYSAHPIVYRGDVVAVVADGEVYSAGWIAPTDRPVVRAMALGALDAPYFTPEQLHAFAAYYLLPDDRWDTLRFSSDGQIARLTNLPLDLIQVRRKLPRVEPATIEGELAEIDCAEIAPADIDSADRVAVCA